MSFRRGIVTEIYPDKGRCRVKFTDDDIVSAPLQIIFLSTQDNKFYIPFAINELVAVQMDINGEDGIVLGCLYNDTDAPPDGVNSHSVRMVFSDGAIFSYDWNDHKLTVDAGSEGEINIVADGNVEINADGGATINASSGGVLIRGDVSIQGNLDVQDDVTAGGKVDATGKVVSSTEVEVGLIKLTLHKHGGVTAGAGTTSPSIP